MKQIVVLLALTIVSLQSWCQTFAICDTSPSGHVLYYRYHTSLINGEYQVDGVSVDYPNHYGYEMWPVNKPYGDLIIPDSITYNDTTYAVVYIKMYTFYNCNLLSSVVIPPTVVSIGENAFENCTALTSVTFPNDIREIGSEAFRGCTSLTYVSLPDSLRVIKSETFKNCYNLDTVILPSHLTTIESKAFYHCNQFSLQLPNALEYIGDSAFWASHLSSGTIAIPASVTHLGSAAFGYYHYHKVYWYPEESVEFGAYYGGAPFSSIDSLVITGCAAFEFFHGQPSWINHIYYPAESLPIISVVSENDAYGECLIIQQYGHDVGCDSTVIVQATTEVDWDTVTNWENYLHRYDYHFDHWSNGSTQNPLTITLPVEYDTLVAYFERNRYSLDVRVNDTSMGSISFPDGNSFLSSDSILIVAHPAAHHHVVAWTASTTAFSPSRDYYTLRTGGDTLYLASIMSLFGLNNDIIYCNFAVDSFTVSVEPNDISRGTVTGGGEFEYGVPCILQAIAYSGYTFSHWSNGVTDNPYAFPVVDDVELQAVFIAPGEESHTISAVSADPSMGSATVNGQTTFVAMIGSELNLMAFPNVGYRFDHWQDNNTDNPRTITVTGDATYTAYFASTEGIEDIDISGIRVYSIGGQIVVDTKLNDEISIYDMYGRKVDGGRKEHFDAPSSGVYLVKVGSLPSQKVVVIK